MCDEWMPALSLPLTGEQFHQLPRHPAYRYEYLQGSARLTPRPRFYHALLDLDQFSAEPPAPGVNLRLLEDGDFDALPRLFAGAFGRQQPFAGLDPEQRLTAARASLDKARAGTDGPWIRAASFAAMDKDHQPVGAILVTLLPDADPADWDSFHWAEPPPADCLERRLGRPHITWIFVSPWHTGRGTGTALLAASVAELRGLGYRCLASTFLLGNDSSMLWHWRNGFALQTYPASRRRWSVAGP
jgi:hypothetical protein